MNLIENFQMIRCKINEEIKRFELKLDDLTIFTEAASGLFAITPFIAAIGGAKKVYALEFDSAYASREEVREIFNRLTKLFNLPEGVITFVPSKRFEELSQTDILTNQGGVRPIDKKTIHYLKENAVIPLMFEGWEFREEDIDLKACKEKSIPVFGTNELYAGVFNYCSILTLKLLLELNVELLEQNMLLIGDHHFLEVIETTLKKLGINTISIITEGKNSNEITEFLSEKAPKNQPIEAIIIADAITKIPVIHSQGLIDPHFLYNITRCSKVIQIAGQNDVNHLHLLGMTVHPNYEVLPQRMPKSLAYVGITPLVRLQTAGLKVGEIMIKYRKKYSYSESIRKILQEPLISPIPSEFFHNNL